MDVEIVRSAQCGDRAAVASIVDEFTPTVLGAAFGLTGDWDAAADVAQEVFATATARLADLRDPAALPGWLMAIVRSSARRQRRRPPRLAHAPNEPSPEEAAVARDEAQRVRRAVERLPADLRLPVVLHYFAGRSIAEIAGLCDLPSSTVKQRMRVARARLREGVEHMQDDGTMACGVGPATDPTDVIVMYTAMRSGDRDRVARILDRRPDLVDVREHWTRAESFAHRLPWTRGGGTPLLRAVERGDVPIVRLLLERGADPDGECTCEGGERPLWVAVVQRETEIVDLLLDHGADPNTAAFAGVSALEVARRRGYLDVHERLLRAGATPIDGSPVESAAPAATGTGIKAIDLWCPLPTSGVVHLTPGFGLGAVVLISELSFRAAAQGRRVVWTGFVPAPTDLGDIHHALAESDIAEAVALHLAPPGAPEHEQVRCFDRGIDVAGADAFLVVFTETGRLHHVDERLATLAGRRGLSLVVAPLDGSVGPPARHGSPYLASIVFDVDRARSGRWPAIGSDSWSKVADERLAPLADRARANRTEALERYLCQPFFVAEPVTGRTGESVSLDQLESDLVDLCDGPSPVP